MLSGMGVNNKPSGLLHKFEDYKKNVWMSGVSPSARHVELDEKAYKWEKKNDVGEESMVARDDAGGGAGGHGSSGGGVADPTHVIQIDVDISWAAWEKYLAVHTGVPAWK